VGTLEGRYTFAALVHCKVPQRKNDRRVGNSTLAIDRLELGRRLVYLLMLLHSATSRSDVFRVPVSPRSLFYLAHDRIPHVWRVLFGQPPKRQLARTRVWRAPAAKFRRSELGPSQFFLPTALVGVEVGFGKLVGALVEGRPIGSRVEVVEGRLSSNGVRGGLAAS